MVLVWEETGEPRENQRRRAGDPMPLVKGKCAIQSAIRPPAFCRKLNSMFDYNTFCRLK